MLALVTPAPICSSGGAAQKLEDQSGVKGNLDAEAAFYAYWRKSAFNIGRAVQ